VAAVVARPWGFLYAALFLGVIFLVGLGQWMESRANSAQPQPWRASQAPPQQWVYLEGQFEGKLGDFHWLRTADQTLVLVQAAKAPPSGFLRVQGMARFVSPEVLKKPPLQAHQADFYLAAGERPAHPVWGLLLMLSSLLAGLAVAQLWWRGGLVFEGTGESGLPTMERACFSLAGKFWMKEGPLSGEGALLEVAALTDLESGFLHWKGKRLPAWRGRKGRQVWLITCVAKP
jgi:hypothetical protein